MIDRFIQTFVALKVFDFYGGANHNVRTQLFKLDNEIVRLGARARDHNRFARQRQI
jgi:hypothetical protein